MLTVLTGHAYLTALCQIWAPLVTSTPVTSRFVRQRSPVLARDASMLTQ
jgi:hypothetical protein